jgi:hypothetical protein
MKINNDYIKEYKDILIKTNLQRDYQEFIKFFRYLRIFLGNELKDYTFTDNIVENNMDYSYFQFTNKSLKDKGLKIVIAFVHKSFTLEAWLSGFNRKIQTEYYGIFKNKHLKYELTNNPNRTDYVLKNDLEINFDYDDLDKLMNEIKDKVIIFINNVNK